jgi:uncharacterized protein YcgI (DUF1989 family)
MDNFLKGIIIFIIISAIGIAFLIKNLNEVISNCPGLVLQTPNGWACTNVEKMVTTNCPGLVLQTPNGWACTNAEKMVTK